MLFFNILVILAMVQTCVAACSPTHAQRICSWSGDPHYRSHDNINTRRVNFQGICLYVASQTKTNCTSQLKPFRVLVVNEHRYGKTHVSYTKKVIIEWNNKRWHLNKGVCTQAQVGGPTTPPFTAMAYCTFGGGVIPCSGANVQVWRTFTPGVPFLEEILVCYDGDHTAAIRVPKTYCEHLEGLCGNFDQNPADDWEMRNGFQATGTGSVKDANFGNDWIVAVHPDTPNITQCTPGSGNKQWPTGVFPKVPIDVALKARALCKKKLGADITDSTLASCRKQHPGIMENNQKDCEFDVARGGLMKTENTSLAYACNYMAAIVSECEAIFNKGIQWRAATGCPLNCPKPMVFSSSAPACQATCADSKPNCTSSLRVESFGCPSGMIRDGKTCVSKCGGGEPCNPCTARRDLTYANRVFWGASSSTSGNWQDLLPGSPMGGLETTSDVTIVFKPADNLCFIPKQICINPKTCKVSFSCVDTTLSKDDEKSDDCVKAECKVRSVSIKCPIGEYGYNVIWVSSSQILSKAIQAP